VPAPPDESAEDLYENAPCGYLSADPDGRILRANATFLRWTGYAHDQLVGHRRFAELLTAGGRIYHETHYAPLLRMQGAVRGIALEIVCADGSRLPVLVNSELHGGASGAPVIRTTVFDATDRRRYERELRAARDRERTARERVERLQEITATLAAAPDARAIAAAVARDLAAYFGTRGAGVAAIEDGVARILAIEGELPPDAFGDNVPAFDEGETGGRGARVRLRLTDAPDLDTVLALAFGAPRPFASDERAFLLTCAEHTALALSRSRHYELQRGVAHTLQQSLLAGPLPVDPRYELATAYEPAVEHLEVGGDWYDAITLDSDRVAIVVGDVVGRGLGAASAMGQLRSAVRALAATGATPAGVLRHLDAFVSGIEAARYATLAYAEVDPGTGAVRCAAAGHPPPLRFGPARAPEYLLTGRSTPLGVLVPGEARTDAAFSVEPGGGFLLYTDGLVERRTEVIDVGLARLADAVRARPDASPAELVEALLGELREPGAMEDDVCLLGFRRRA
jgi:PAS domain S-box-containing protein